jgi:hypothetical protein
MEEFEALWARQTQDKDWTANVVGYIDALLDAADAAPTFLKNVDCRQTLCRIVLQPDGIASLQGASGLAVGDGMRFAFQLDAGADGNSVTVFLAQEGVEDAFFPTEQLREVRWPGASGDF